MLTIIILLFIKELLSITAVAKAMLCDGILCIPLKQCLII